MRRAVILSVTVLMAATLAGTSAVAETRKGFFESLSDSFQDLGKKKKRSTYKAPKPSQRTVEIQLYLNSLGFDAGKADGLSGARTRNAISEYQTARGLTPTGNLTDSQFDDLKAEADGSLETKSDDTIEIQGLLTQMGFFEGQVDGEWGPDSQDALDLFRSFVALPVGPAPTSEDLEALKEAVLAVTPPEASVFDNVILFGNKFSLSEPDLGQSKMTWTELKPHIFSALPQSRFQTLRAIDAQSLISARTNQISSAYQAQIDMLHAILRPDIQAYAGREFPTDQITQKVEDFDIEIARGLLSGNGIDMINKYGLATPSAARAISVAQETTYRLQALRALEENTIEIVPIGLADAGTASDGASGEDTATALPAFVATLPTAVTIKGLNIFGMASNTSNTWPYILEFKEFNSSSGDFEGQLEWTNLEAVHSVRGSITNDGKLHFTEYSTVSPGEVVLGCEYWLSLPDDSQQSLTGSFKCAGETGTASAEFPDSFVWAALPPPMPLTPN
ncbi:MAG: peptidoglycan-binding domain-containing protein [Marinosulfonomonas sp.]